MIASNYYSDTLRAVGLLLEQVDATGIQINDEGVHWSLKWDEAAGPNLQPEDLDALRTVARLHRGLHPRDSARFTRAQQLRTVGQFFDRLQATSFGICETAEGFQLAARVADQEGIRVYPHEEIARMAEEQQGRRFGGEPA